MVRTAFIALRAHPWRTVTLFSFLALAALMLRPSSGRADATPFPIQGDDTNNTITISVTIDGNVEFCVDWFCADQPISEVQTIDISGLGGDDTIVIDETNGNFPNIVINVDGGSGRNVLEICPASTGFCSSSGIESTTYTPGPDVQAGAIEQVAAGGSTTAIDFVNTGSVLDGAPGALTTNGTPGDNAITYVAGPHTDSTQAYGLVTVDNLASYEFTNKDSLAIDTGGGTDTVQDNAAGTPTGMSGTCDGNNTVCVVGGGAADDSLVVNGIPGATDHLAVTPAGGAGAIDGVANTPRIGYAGVSAIKLVLQYGADGDTLRLAGSPGDDLVQINATTLPGNATISGTYDQAGGAPFPLPAIMVTGGSPGASGALTVAGGGGIDQLTYAGTDQNDAISSRHAGGTDVLTHSVGSTPLENVIATGFENSAVEGLGGNDTLQDGDAGDAAATPLATSLSWDGGTGTDALSYSAAASAGSVVMGEGSVEQPGSGPVLVSSVENVDVDAAGNGLSAVGTSGSDTMHFTPTSADGGTVTNDADPATYTVDGVQGLFTIEPGNGTDQVIVNGTSAADDIPLTRDPSGTLTVQVASLLPARISAAAEAVQLLGRGSGDRFLVGGTGGPASLSLTGGPDPGSDRILLAGNLADATVTGAAASATGQLTAGGPAIDFAGIAHVSVSGDGTGTLTVNATSSVTSMSQTGASVQLSDDLVVDYAGYHTLSLAGGPDTAQLNVEPATAAVSLVDVDGGPAGASSGTLDVLGTALSDRLTYRPSAPTAGEVDLGGAASVAFTRIGSVLLDGNTDAPSGDSLVVDTSQIHGTQVLDPGATFDAGAVRFRNGADTTNTAAPLTFGQFGAGSVTVADDTRIDDLVYDGTAASDVFKVDTSGQVLLNGQLPLRTPGVATLELHGSGGADTFALPPAHPFPGSNGGPGIVTDGGMQGAGDQVNLDASGDDVAVDYDGHSLVAGASTSVALPAVQFVTVSGATTLAVTGTGDPDVLRYTPTGAQSGGITRDNSALEVRFTDLAGALRVDGDAGSDTVAVNGTSSADAIDVARGDPSTVQVAALKTLELPAATEALQVTGGAGADTFNVTGTGGPADVQLDGGGPAGVGDRLDFNGSSAAVVAGVVPYNGNVKAPSGNVGYVNLDVVSLQGDSTGSLAVAGTSGNDALSVGGATVPEIRVNAGTEIQYAGYPTATVDGAEGADSIDMSYHHIGDVQNLTLTGGGQLGDHLNVLDRPGVTDTVRVVPTGTDAGTLAVDGINPSIGFGGVASLVLDGSGGGDHVVVGSASGDNAVRVTPGSADDAATVRVDAFVPFSFQNLGTGGSLRLVDADGVRADNLTYDGTGGSDAFTVAGDTGTVTLNTRLPVIADGVADLVLRGQDGDDSFGIVGPLPFTTINADGGAAGPNGDTLSLSGAATGVSVDLGRAQVTGYGGTVGYPGTETINTDASAQNLTMLGTSGDDTLCYDPMTLTAGRAYLMGASGSGGTTTVCDPTQRGAGVLANFTSVGQLFLDPSSGVDQVIVDGTAGADLVTLLMTTPWVTVDVHPAPTDPTTNRLTASVANASTENIAIHTLDGQDDIDVHPYDNPAPTMYLDGGSPINKSAGNVADQMEVHDGGGVAHLHTYKSHVAGTGEVTATFRDGVEQDFNYFDVESLTTIQNSK